MYNALNRAKGDTSSGTDGIHMKYWKKMTGIEHVLAPLFNRIVKSETVPSSWLQSRLILIPKVSNPDPLDTSEYRPISITQTLYRVFMSVLNTKLRDIVQLSPSQKGFMPGEGCVEHSFVLQEILDDCRRGSKRLSACWIDLRKAFDSVPHWSILLQLERQEVPKQVIGLIKFLYANSFSQISDQLGCKEDIHMNGRGVKQGCPLSPLLFNLVIDPFLQTIDTSKLGFNIRGNNIGALCYADDIVITSNNTKNCQVILDTLSKFLTICDMQANVKKCAALQVSYISGRRVINDPKLHATLTLNSTDIPLIDDFYKYLGTNKDLSSFKEDLPQINEFKTKLSKISDSFLFPYMKAEILRVYLYPIIDYVLKTNCLRVEDLKSLDTFVLNHVRNWFQLPKCSNRSFFYTPIKLGGLGLRNISNDFHSLRLASALTILNSKDDRVAQISQDSLKFIVHNRTSSTTYINNDPPNHLIYLNYLNADCEAIKSKDIRSLLSSIRLNRKALGVTLTLPTDNDLQIDLDVCSLLRPHSIFVNQQATPTRIKLLRWHNQCKEFNRWKSLLDQGKTASCIAQEPESNSWIRNGQIKVTTCRFAIHARMNLLPTKAVLKKVKKAPDSKCRRCRCELETLGHILSKCKHNEKLIIVRHNNILNFLSDKVKLHKNWVVNKDKQSIPTSTRRPDLVILNSHKKKAIIVDVTLSYENNPQRLIDVREAKISKYLPEKAILEQLGYQVHLDALVYGSLGSHLPSNFDVYRQLGITRKNIKRIKKTITTMALEDSHNIFKSHVSGSGS